MWKTFHIATMSGYLRHKIKCPRFCNKIKKRDSAEFGFEKDLQNFLVKNLDLIEPGLKLYENEGITGVEYPVGNRFADILAIDYT